MCKVHRESNKEAFGRNDPALFYVGSVAALQYIGIKPMKFFEFGMIERTISETSALHMLR
ncbi:hypothetical protein CS953_13065 [Bacillus safensis]|nr:hypothetical protein CS953_13065 [Bacillus safensis]